jgi:glycosyltransferase involved in cell wall biosynthesis
MAVETVAVLKARGLDSVLIAVGGAESHQGDVLHRAQDLGLVVRPVTIAEPTSAGLMRAFTEARPGDVLNVRSFMPPPLLRPLYAASDAVLVNSGREPFGLVGLEAMATGAVVFTGGTGEDYAVHLENAIVLETSDAEEAAWHIRYLARSPAVAEDLSREARRTARRFLWDRVVDNLLSNVEFLAMRQGMTVTEPAATPHVRGPRGPCQRTPATTGRAGRGELRNARGP